MLKGMTRCGSFKILPYLIWSILLGMGVPRDAEIQYGQVEAKGDGFMS